MSTTEGTGNPPSVPAIPLQGPETTAPEASVAEAALQAPAPAPAPASTPAPPRGMSFVGDAGAYWRLLFRGGALLAATLGIYRFWFATDVRRYLWSNTEIAGETLEYTGTATELLVGFLIALALLVPLYISFFIVALGLGPLGQLMSVLGFPILAFLGHFAVYRARRYRLTRTIYRGVRCHQAGSALRYAVCALFWWTLIVFTLGLAYPFSRSRLERYKMQRTYYGNLQGGFVGSGIGLFLRGLPMWLLTVGPLAFALFFTVSSVEWDKLLAAAATAGGSSDFLNQIERSFPNVYAAIVVIVSAVGVSLLMAAILLPIFQAMMLRWWLSGLRFGELSVHCRLKTSAVYGAYMRFLGWSLLFSLGASIAGSILYSAFGVMLASVTKEPQAAEIYGAAFGVGMYVVMMLGFSTIYQGTVKFTLWRRGAESVEISGADVLERVRAEGVPSSAVGEGLADALNVGGI